MDFEKKEKNRFNDGKCDPHGRLWVGTMAENCEGKEGSLICFNPDKSYTVERQNVGISNGLAWTADNKIMYFIDTPTCNIFAFDFDVNSGKITNERVAVHVDEKEAGGKPDGMTIDSAGCLWVAIYGGGKVIKFDPQTGKEEGQIVVPSQNVTSCCFGGPNLNTLYITTSRGDDNDNSKYPEAGGLFSYSFPFSTGIVGVPMHRFNLKSQ